MILDSWSHGHEHTLPSSISVFLKLGLANCMMKCLREKLQPKTWQTTLFSATQTKKKHSGLSRCGKSCRLRWANHLNPDLKKGAFTPEEERRIIELHAKMGNKWARMAIEVYSSTFFPNYIFFSF
uniref:HTH myb-type domain-containing protein n=1 Tax=Lactuca sativa TaxID=4236 RepID=A0A9R1XGY9_LACSA|nr:hypothetical protein LSAT_V11C500286770 [Lactuca sativa]